MSLRVPPAARKILSPIAALAAETGVGLYVVGGAVRDWLLGRASHDFDLVVEGDPEPLARATARRLGRKIEFFGAFGTARLSAVGDVRLDFAAARRETYPEPAALPVVERCALIGEDLYRRDFSINAVAWRLSPGPEGLVDPYGGVEDMKRGVVRFLHAESFRDDPTRVFRAARYATRLGFKTAPELDAAAARALAQGWAAKLSRHRLAQELMRIFDEYNPAASFATLKKWGYLDLISPALKTVRRWPDWKGLDAEEKLAATALLLPRDFLSSLPLERGKIAWFTQLYESAAQQRSPTASLGAREARVAKAARLKLAPASLKARFLTGADLQKQGLAPGPRFRELLDEAASLQWAGKLASRPAALKWLFKAARR